MTPPTSDEQMIVTTSRLLADGEVAFVGVGLPSAAAVLALRTRAPRLFLVYESGVLGAQPPWLPLSVADDGLAEHALALVGVPEMFAYWLQGGHIDVGILGAAQVDRYANINSTVVGAYDAPVVRLPGAGGAPEIAGAAGRVIVMVRQTARSFVNAVDFVTTVGHLPPPATRGALGLPGGGPAAVVTDVGVYEPQAHGELMLTSLQPGRTVEEARGLTAWALAVATDVREEAPPTDDELRELRRLQSDGRGS